MAPVATTLKVASLPEQTARLAGWVVIVGPDPVWMINVISLVKVILPETPVIVMV